MTTADIDRDIWIPFMTSYDDLDAELFVSIYSRDLIRAGGPSGVVQTYEEYVASAREFMAHAREQGDAFEIEFRFTERLVTGATASERGVFEIKVKMASGEERLLHGAFHVFERVEDGSWRILTDYDSNEGGAIGADAFAAATPITLSP